MQRPARVPTRAVSAPRTAGVPPTTPGSALPGSATPGSAPPGVAPVRTGPDRLMPAVVWLIPVLLATAATLVTAGHLLVEALLLAVALVPWVLDVAGRALPVWLFGTLVVGPVVAVLIIDGLNASIFLVTTACCSIASQSNRSWQVAAVAVVGIAVPFASAVNSDPFDLGVLYFVIGNLFGTAVGVLIGHTRRLGAELRAADARLQARAAQDERAQLARDVHDLVAHSLTVVVLQVGGARRVLRTKPNEAQAALEQAERVCRESLDGVREVVGLLRSGDDAPHAAADLPQLVETYRAAGMAVDVEFDDRAAELPLLVRGTMYRVVRESLANAARYRAPGSTVSVRIDVELDGVSLRVTNPGAPGQRTGPGGYGLRGLTEQVTGIGGSLTSGPADGEWRVECRLPRTVSAGRVETVA